MTFSVIAFDEKAFLDDTPADGGAPPEPPPTGTFPFVAAFHETAFGDEVPQQGPHFIVSPHVTSAQGDNDFTMLGSGSTWTASNPFSIVTGGSFASIVAYTNFTAEHAVLTLNILSLGGAVVIADSSTGTRYNIQAQGLPPDPPGIGFITDNGNGTINVPFTPPVEDGGAPVDSYLVTLSTGQTAIASGSPMIISATNGAATTATVKAINAFGASGASAPSNSITPTRSVATTFYLSTAGDDSNTGLSTFTAWRSISRLNLATLFPGDTVLFEGGGSFTGTIAPGQSGTAGVGNYIFFSTVGRTRPSSASDISTWVAQSNPAIISCGNADGIQAWDRQYVWFDNLDITGSGVNPSTGVTTSTGMGGSIKSTQATNKLLGVRLTALTINGCKDGMFAWTANAAQVGFDDLKIWDVLVEECQRVGIVVLNHDGVYASGTRTQNTNVYVGHSEVRNCPGLPGGTGVGVCAEGISIRNTTTGLIEESVVHDINLVGDQGAQGGTHAFNAGMSDAVVFRRVEAYHTFAPTAVDGVAIDFESGAINCVCEYSYFHDNDGGGYLYGNVVNATNTGNVFRYNVCARNAINNGAEIYNFGFTAGSQLASSLIYGNTIYASNGDAYWLGATGGGKTTSGPVDKLYNNILVSEAGAKCVNGTPNDLEGNDYFAIGGGVTTVITHTSLAALQAAGFEQEGQGAFGNPLLISPTSGVGVGSLPNNPVSNVTYFDISSGSAAIDKGVDLTAAPFSLSIGAVDFHGNDNLIGTDYDSGAVEFQTTNSVTRVMHHLRSHR